MILAPGFSSKVLADDPRLSRSPASGLLMILAPLCSPLRLLSTVLIFEKRAKICRCSLRQCLLVLVVVCVTFLRSSVSVSPDIGFTLALKAQRNDPLVMGRINVSRELNP
jgi:hypothetical protein